MHAKGMHKPSKKLNFSSINQPKQHLTGGQGVASSNLAVPTPLINSTNPSIFRGVFYYKGFVHTCLYLINDDQWGTQNGEHYFFICIFSKPIQSLTTISLK